MASLIPDLIHSNIKNMKLIKMPIIIGISNS